MTIVNTKKCLIVRLYYAKNIILIFQKVIPVVSTRLDPSSSNQTIFITKYDKLKITVFYPLLDKLLSMIDLRFKQDTFDLVGAMICMLNLDITQNTMEILSKFSKVSEED